MLWNTLLGAFFGALFAFIFSLVIQYFKFRNRLKFNILKTEHILESYKNYLNSAKEKSKGFLNQYPIDQWLAEIKKQKRLCPYNAVKMRV